ncbi:HAD hydrolase family protein [Paeniglutamicibacter sp. Y32M11]|nr:HAD hydrolase family protein [Paeniglutamicibacter sp. Y32M11]
MHAKSQIPSKTMQAAFLVVDGTYADYGVVPKAHAAAVCTARATGHKLLLCTGRPLSMLPTHILEVGFDGLEASAGAYVEGGRRNPNGPLVLRGDGGMNPCCLRRSRCRMRPRIPGILPSPSRCGRTAAGNHRGVLRPTLRRPGCRLLGHLGIRGSDHRIPQVWSIGVNETPLLILKSRTSRGVCLGEVGRMSGWLGLKA